MTLILEIFPHYATKICTFCGKDQTQVDGFIKTDRLVGEMSIRICNECISLSSQIMEGKAHFLEVNKLREDKWAGLAANKVLDVRVKELQAKLALHLGPKTCDAIISQLLLDEEHLLNLLATSLDILRWASGAFTVAGYPGIWDKIGAGFVKQLEGMGLNGKGCMSHGVSFGVFSKPILVGEIPP